MSPRRLTGDDLARACDFLYRRTGLVYGESKRYYVERRLAARMGAIGAAEYKRIQTKSSTELMPYECIVQGVVGTPTDATIMDPVTKARDCLERLTHLEPRNAAAWAALVLVFNNQRNWGFPSPTGEVASVDTRLYLADKAVEAANRAVEIAPNDAFVRGLVARAAWMACQPDLLRIETMRAIALNCPSSNGLGQSESFRDGGSGSFGIEFRRLSTDVAIVAV